MVQANARKRLAYFSVTSVIAMVLTTSLILRPTSAAATPTSAPISEVYGDADLSIRSGALDAANDLVTVNLKNSGKQISVTFSHSKQQDHLWKRLWFSKGQARLSVADKQVLHGHLAKISRIEPRAQAVVDFLADFLPVDEDVQPFDQVVDLPTGFLAGVRFQFESERYTMICDSIGQLHDASFTNGTTLQVTTQLVPVGALDSACRGRCGTGCEQAGQWRHNQYTQECLNHDICHDTTGRQLGPCEHMFWQAAPGYLLAPDCTEKAIAVGPNLPVIIPTPPVGSNGTNAQPIPDPDPSSNSNTTPASQAPPGSLPNIPAGD